jgi:hypothetical protein
VIAQRALADRLSDRLITHGKGVVGSCRSWAGRDEEKEQQRHCQLNVDGRQRLAPRFADKSCSRIDVRMRIITSTQSTCGAGKNESMNDVRTTVQDADEAPISSAICDTCEQQVAMTRMV